MDSKINIRGRARNNPQPRFPGGQSPRFVGPKPRLPGQLGAVTPRVPSWPRAPVQHSQTSYLTRTPRPQALRPENQHSYPIQVEQITKEVGSLSSGNMSPIGRGPLRGNREIDPELLNFFRMPRPVSSKNGKEGNIGQKLDLVANYFPIKSYTDWTLYQYKIDFSPDEEFIAIKRGLLRVHQEKLGAYIFDGSMLFSSTNYDSKELKLISKRSSDGEFVTITVTLTSVLQPQDYVYLQVYNLIMRNVMRHLNLTQIGHNYYDPAATINIAQHKLQVWPGYDTAINMYDSGLLLRTEISSRVMRNESVHNFFQDCVNNSRTNFMDNFKAGVIGTVVLTRYNNQTYKIDDIDETKSPKSTFKIKDGTLMTYLDYYKKKWNVIIRDTNQPMLLSKKKNISSTKKFRQDDDVEDLVFLVPELCTLTGLSQSMRGNFNLMRNVASYTRVDPFDRVKRYHNFINRVHSTTESVNALKKWNLELHNELVKFEGRVLNQQKIYSNNKVHESGNKGDWTNFVRSNPMFLSAKIQRWIILFPQQNEVQVQAFFNALKGVSNNMSFNLPQPTFYPMNSGSLGEYSKVLEEIINQMNPSFILCVLQSQRSDIYNLIKRHLCINRAVPSQIVLMKYLIKVNLSVYTKIAIQINCKLGGAPWKISIPTKGIMIIGFDVCHDKDRKDRSYGALVASLNDDHTLYYSSVQPHPSGHEVSTKFAVSITGAINAYRNHNNKLPAMIIIYRDGIGDGQISHVHKTEVKLVKDACQNFYGKDSEPPMAFIIVKKRISTRYFCSQDSKFRNPPAGTVVDSVITDPTMYDFFLVSQFVTFGTVTPTHYNVIVDTLPDWSPNKMQLLTYKLTHMYYNWSGTVRVPAHCQLAHKLAFFVSQSLQGTPNSALNELLYFL